MATRYRKCRNIFPDEFPGTETLYISYQTTSSAICVYDEDFNLIDWYTTWWDDADEDGYGETNNTEFHERLDEYLNPIYESYDKEYRLTDEEEDRFRSSRLY